MTVPQPPAMERADEDEDEGVWEQMKFSMRGFLQHTIINSICAARAHVLPQPLCAIACASVCTVRCGFSMHPEQTQ